MSRSKILYDYASIEREYKRGVPIQCRKRPDGEWTTQMRPDRDYDYENYDYRTNPKNSVEALVGYGAIVVPVAGFVCWLVWAVGFWPVVVLTSLIPFGIVLAGYGLLKITDRL